MAHAEEQAVPAAPAAVPEWKRFTPTNVDPTRCMARVWGEGKGTQCARKYEESTQYCKLHCKNESWKVHGRVDGPIPEAKLSDFLKEERKGPRQPREPRAKREADAVTPSPKKAKAESGESLTPDSNRVKKPSAGSYGVWLSENREVIKNTLPAGSNPITDVAKKATEMWKEVSAEARQAYQAKYDEKMEAYKEYMLLAKADGLGQPAATKKTINAEKRRLREEKKEKRMVRTPEGLEVKRPAFGAKGVWFSENRANIKAQLPADHKMCDVPKQAAAMWKAISAEEKADYQSKFEAKNAIFKDARMAQKAREDAKKELERQAGKVVAPVMKNLLKQRRKKTW